MGSRINRLLERKEHVDRTQLGSCFNFWDKRLVLGFGASAMALGVSIIICFLMPDDDLLNLSLTARNIIDEVQSAFISL